MATSTATATTAASSDYTVSFCSTTNTNVSCTTATAGVLRTTVGTAIESSCWSSALSAYENINDVTRVYNEPAFSVTAKSAGTATYGVSANSTGATLCTPSLNK
jgi:hypothetical protein